MDKLNKKQLVDLVKEKYQHYKNIQSYNIEELRKILSSNCNQINIYNETNSCYLDSFFISLFAGENENIKNIFINSENRDYKNKKLNELADLIREEINNIYNKITKKTTTKTYCTQLRRLFQDYHNIKYKERSQQWRKEQMESFDVIMFLLNIFKIKNTNKINIKKYATNSLKKQIIFKNIKLVSDNTINNDITSIISLEKIKLNPILEIKTLYPRTVEDIVFDKDNLWKTEDGEEYIRKIEKQTFLSGDFLFIHINRNDFSTGFPVKLNTYIIPCLNIKMKENKYNLYLKSIIIHHGEYGGGHYTTAYICDGKWYMYDDLNPSKQLIGDGSFEDLCKYKKGYILKNCTNFIYY